MLFQYWMPAEDPDSAADHPLPQRGLRRAAAPESLPAERAALPGAGVPGAAKTGQDRTAAGEAEGLVEHHDVGCGFQDQLQGKPGPTPAVRSQREQRQLQDVEGQDGQLHLFGFQCA